MDHPSPKPTLLSSAVLNVRRILSCPRNATYGLSTTFTAAVALIGFISRLSTNVRDTCQCMGYILTTQGNVPEVHFYGVDKDYRVLVLDLLGPSLADLFTFCKNKVAPIMELVAKSSTLTHSLPPKRCV